MTNQIMKIEKVANGYTVEYYPIYSREVMVFKTFEELVVFMRRVYNEETPS